MSDLSLTRLLEQPGSQTEREQTAGEPEDHPGLGADPAATEGQTEEQDRPGDQGEAADPGQDSTGHPLLEVGQGGTTERRGRRRSGPRGGNRPGDTGCRCRYGRVAPARHRTGSRIGYVCRSSRRRGWCPPGSHPVRRRTRLGRRWRHEGSRRRRVTRQVRVEASLHALEHALQLVDPFLERSIRRSVARRSPRDLGHRRSPH